MTQANTAINEPKYLKQIFIGLSALVLIAMPILSSSYGQSGDEWLQIIYGRHIWEYFVNGNQQAIDYTNQNLQYTHQEYYGGMFDFPMEALHHLFPSIQILILRHFFNALLGALMMVFTGLFAYRLSKKWSVGLIALLFIVFSPRIFGESMNNPKDIPFAAGFVIGFYFLVALLQDFPNKVWKHGIGIMLGFGLAFGVRSAGGILLLAYFMLFIALYYVLHKDLRATLFADGNKLLKKLLLVVGVSVLAGYIIGLSTWPWGLQDPIGNPIESLKGMTNREAYLRVLFDGSYYMSNTLPWYYEFKWIFISNPLAVLIGFILMVVLAMKLRKTLGTYVVVLVLFGALFPLLYMIYKHSTVYDTWRHVFFVYPFWVIASALGWDAVGTFIKDETKQWIPKAVAVLILLPAIIWTFRSHPNQYVYFNELEGGAKGAYGYYDLDYYQNSGKQAGDWIIKNAKHINGRKVYVLSNMGGFDNYFANDTAWLRSDYGRYSERHRQNWDYYVAYPRYISAQLMQNKEWKLQNTVHTVEIDGVPLCVVIQRKDTSGIAANEAFEKKDFVTAAQKYAAYIATDNTDEYAYFNYAIALASSGQIEPAIQAMVRATKLDPDRPEFYDVLAQLYQSKGDMQNAQQAQSMKNEIMMRQQENEE